MRKDKKIFWWVIVLGVVLLIIVFMFHAMIQAGYRDCLRKSVGVDKGDVLDYDLEAIQPYLRAIDHKAKEIYHVGFTEYDMYVCKRKHLAGKIGDW